MTLSVRDMAKALGIGKSQVQRDKDAGMPMGSADEARTWRLANRDVARSADGRIDRPASNSTPRAEGGTAAAAGGASAPPASPEEDAPQSGDTEEYRRNRAAREAVRLERERLELDQARGRLIDVNEAARMAFTTFRAVRDQCMNLAPGLSHELAALTDALAIEQRIHDALAGVFSQFDEARLLRDADAEDQDEDAPG